MALVTLHRMSSGGMYDQLAGGWARYSVDAEWRVPHFEKMLYDQGQLLAVAADAWRLSRDPGIERVIVQTVEYLDRDMKSPNGAFYSAEDADSEGEEGAFYVWTGEQLRELLDEREYEILERFYGITGAGNFERGLNVLHTSATIGEIAAERNESEEEISAVLASARARLFEARESRTRPARDEKILTSWNGLLIGGLARCGAALGRAAITGQAQAAADAILTHLASGERLMHRMKDGESGIEGYLEDYAFLASGLLDLYEATFEVRYLRRAEEFVRTAIELFHDPAEEGFFMTAGNDPSVLVRAKGDHDGAEPSGNSVMALNLLRLGRLFHDERLQELGRETVELFTARASGFPMAMPLIYRAAMALESSPRHLVIAAGSDAGATAEMVRIARQSYPAEMALLYIPGDGPDPWLVQRDETLEGMRAPGAAPAAFLCEGTICHPPVNELTDEMLTGRR